MTIKGVSKSNLMRTAWAKFRECRGIVAFAECLRRAWRAVKYDLAMRAVPVALPTSKAPRVFGALLGSRSRGVLRTQYGIRFLGV